MESFPKRSKISKLERTVRATLAGVAMLGATAATDAQATEATPVQKSHEQLETFNFAQEANAFLENIASLDVGIDDARGRRRLQSVIEERFNIFALSCEKRAPYFSKKSSASLSGTVSSESREAARKYLNTKLLTRLDSNLPITMLRNMLTGSSNVTPEVKKGPSVSNQPPRSFSQPSEVRRSRTDW